MLFDIPDSMIAEASTSCSALSRYIDKKLYSIRCTIVAWQSDSRCWWPPSLYKKHRLFPSLTRGCRLSVEHAHNTMLSKNTSLPSNRIYQDSRTCFRVEKYTYHPSWTERTMVGLRSRCFSRRNPRTSSLYGANHFHWPKYNRLQRHKTQR